MATKAIKRINPGYLADGIEIWQAYLHAYADFMADFALEATQQTLDQAFTFRKNMNQVLVDVVKKTQALNLEEQSLILDSAEAWYAQIQTTSQRITKMLTTFPLN